jgi:hypothetical protein
MCLLLAYYAYYYNPVSRGGEILHKSINVVKQVMKTLKYRRSLFSSNPDALMKFYVETLGYKLVVKVEREDDYGIGIEIACGYKL